MQHGLPTFDLQSHSSHSDGALTPSAVVAAAAGAGVELLALTDHDTVDGVPEAAQAASALGLRLVPAVEISAIDSERGDLHVLGYLIDDRARAFREALVSFRSDRGRRAEVMIEKLRLLGFQLDRAALENRARLGRPIGRPHLADAVVAHPANRARLVAEGCLERSRFLERYLVEGAPAFESRLVPTVVDAIDAIHAAGGVAVWAHPFWDEQAPEVVGPTVERFAESGLDGVECFYPTHTRHQSELLAGQCKALALLSTGSSDFHGPEHGLFSRFRAFKTYGLEAALGPLAHP